MTNEIIKYSVFDKKWLRLRSLVGHVRYIPFVDFVLVSGSMATGEATEESDFDLLVGARAGRIFTVRFFVAGLFELLGVRRRGIDGKSKSRDKVCLNHFVTPESYRLGEPHNEYWAHLYRHLVPVYGKKEAIEAFFNANAWAHEPIYRGLSSIRREWSLISAVGEWLFGGRLGNWLEKRLRRYQVKRIEKNLASSLGYKPIVRYDDAELRFHTDTKRIEEWLTKNRR